jgi:maleylacetoacetate isomerase
MAWKKIPFKAIPVNLLNGESESAEHLLRSPAGFVPVLEIPGSPPRFLTESLSIIRYLEEVHPETETLFARDPFDRAQAWSLAEVINSGTQPIQNIPVMTHHSQDPEEQKKWSKHFIREGLCTYEKLSRTSAGSFSVGDQLSIADLCLLPQLYNAERYHVDYADLSTVLRIERTCQTLPAFRDSHPDQFKPVDFKG